MWSGQYSELDKAFLYAASCSFSITPVQGKHISSDSACHQMIFYTSWYWCTIPICGLWSATALSILSLGVRSDNSQGLKSGAVVTLIRYSITPSLHTKHTISFQIRSFGPTVYKLILQVTVIPAAISTLAAVVRNKTSAIPDDKRNE